MESKRRKTIIKYNTEQIKYDDINIVHSQCSQYSSFEFEEEHITFEEDILQKEKSRHYPLFEDRDKIKLPTDVLDKAEEISQQMHRTANNRSGKRKMRQFICVLYAYKTLGYVDYSAQSIAKSIYMDQSKIKKSWTEFSPAKSGFKYVPNRDNSYNHPVERTAGDYAKNMDFTDDAIEEVKSIISYVIISNPSITKRQTETIASGAVAACASIRGVTIDLEKLNAISGISKSTIKASCQQILQAYNKFI